MSYKLEAKDLLTDKNKFGMLKTPNWHKEKLEQKKRDALDTELIEARHYGNSLRINVMIPPFYGNFVEKCPRGSSFREFGFRLCHHRIGIASGWSKMQSNLPHNWKQISVRLALVYFGQMPNLAHCIVTTRHPRTQAPKWKRTEIIKPLRRAEVQGIVGRKEAAVIPAFLFV